MISYIALKHLHITCAVLSISLFLLRGMLMLRQSLALQQRWLRITPHIVDTALLASAVAMVVWSQQYPFVQNWLTAKVIALIVYIGLGTIALKRGKTRAKRLRAFLAALAVFAYIIAVALSKQPFIVG
ncbi:Conserved hypothetical protein, putative membrane protein [Herminiimonas arsenicoxydans]|uniref:Regulator SirB n=1 Tax=Herminiimonas arsenicoxydans TaxID=204773 RepID=A4G515_HERAR|nr:Conserved hypothetical protein, putative membrane protein [Herminiimonas arsenicoxydans]